MQTLRKTVMKHSKQVSQSSEHVKLYIHKSIKSRRLFTRPNFKALSYYSSFHCQLSTNSNKYMLAIMDIRMAFINEKTRYHIYIGKLVFAKTVWKCNMRSWKVKTVHWIKRQSKALSLSKIFKKIFFYTKQECVHSTRMPHLHYHFLCSVDREIWVKTLIWN